MIGPGIEVSDKHNFYCQPAVGGRRSASRNLPANVNGLKREAKFHTAMVFCIGVSVPGDVTLKSEPAVFNCALTAKCTIGYWQSPMMHPSFTTMSLVQTRLAQRPRANQGGRGFY